MSETPDEPNEQPPSDPMTATSPADAIRALGFDLAAVQAVVITPTTAVAIATDYPEPYTPPTEEAFDGN